MRAIVSSPEGPILGEAPKPTPQGSEVVVRVRASALNRADLAMLKGAAHGAAGGLGAPLGLEWAGEIVEIGPEVTTRRVGDRVMGAGGGAFAEYVKGHERFLYAIPAQMGFEQAAAMPVAIQTMHDAIATNGLLQPGQSVLIQGASSAVGLMGLQIAKLLGAGLVIGSSTNAERRARLTAFGADLAIDTKDAGWVDQVTQATGGQGVDLVIDHVAGPLFNDTMKATRIGGRIVNVGRLAGETGSVDFNLHSLRRITYVGVTFRTRTAAEVAAVIAKASAAVGEALARGDLRMPIDQTFPLQDAPAAFERMAANTHFGKLVLTQD